MIVDVVLFPGMVRVVEGVMVKFPELSLPVQKKTPRLAVFRYKGLLAGPPLAAFQTTWTFRTVIVSCGLVIVILM